MVKSLTLAAWAMALVCGFGWGQDGGVSDDDDTSGALVGQILCGRYELIEFVDSGGLGEIYKARDARLEYRQVAVKVLKADLPSDQVARFKREALLAGGLSSPHVVKVSDFGVMDDGQAFLVMEWLTGQSLGRLLEREGRLPIERAVRIVDGILAGLEAAHGAGVVHRDLKPENVYVVQEPGVTDHVKVLDFGFARVFEGGPAALDVTGEERIIVGTVSYMSPEQLRGQRTDHRSDLYSVAALLFRMLTGRLPYETKGPESALISAAAFRAINITKPPLSLIEIDPAFEEHSAIDELIRRNLAVSPSGRDASAGVMRRGLGSAMGQTQVEGVETAPGAESEMWNNPVSGVHDLALLDPATGRATLPPLSAAARPSAGVTATEAAAAGPATPTRTGSGAGYLFFIGAVVIAAVAYTLGRLSG